MNIQEAREKICELLTMKTTPNYQLEKFEFNKVIIYSAGVTGKLVYKILNHLGVEVVAFLDRKAEPKQKLYDIPIYKPDDQENVTNSIKQIPVMIALDRFKYNMQEIIDYLQNLGYQEAYYNHNLMCKSNFYHFNTTYNASGVDFTAEKKEILEALELLADDRSRAVFVDFLRAYITSDFDNTIINEDLTACVQVDVPFSKGYSCFIDCGAYTGDTFKDLINRHQVNTYVGFEPMLSTFALLNEMVESNRDAYQKAYLYPLGVADKNTYMRFDDELNGGSAISEKGKNTILTVKLDDIMKNVMPTMIKMDVEGAEISALKGAKQTIVNYKPDLAICVYHRLTDLWKIPLLIHNFCKEYKFYLRCHSIATIETILYVAV